MVTLRCSSLDRIRQCQASAFSDGVVIDHQDGAGALGTAAHEGMPVICRGGWPDVEALARKQGVEDGELGILLSLGRKCWEEVAHWFPDPLFEVEMQAEREGVLLTGHADLVSSVATQPDLVMDDELRILDWKFGRGDPPHDYQLRGYAWLGMTHALPMAGFDRVRVCIVRVREQSAEWATYTCAELDEWFAGLVQHVRGPERYSPGRACGYCPRSVTCLAFRGMLGMSMELVQRFAPKQPADLAILLDACRQIEGFTGKARELVKAAVQAAGGVLPVGDGRELAIEQQTRTEVNVAAGWNHLAQAVGGTRPLVRLLSIGKGDLEKAVKRLAEKGQGAATVRELYARLEEAGAMETTFQDRLEVRRSVQPVPTLENKR